MTKETTPDWLKKEIDTIRNNNKFITSVALATYLAYGLLKEKQEGNSILDKANNAWGLLSFNLALCKLAYHMLFPDSVKWACYKHIPDNVKISSMQITDCIKNNSWWIKPITISAYLYYKLSQKNITQSA